MAIEIVIGNVGSGKTYYATWRIWQEIKKIYEADIKGYNYKYKRILTNIEGIQPNKYVKLLKVDELIKLYEEELKIYKKWEEANAEVDFSNVDFNKKEIITDIDDLKLKEIVEHYPNHDENVKEFKNYNDKILEHIKIQNDKELAYIEYTKPIFQKAGYSDCLIVIDEAHNYFKALSAAKERLVSYHRHYDQDYIFITQDLTQLSRKVTGIAQKTIKAVNPVMKATKTFTYKVYSGGYISYRDTNLLEKIKLKADPDIFRLYHSGSSKTQKSYLFKVLAKPVGLLVALILGILLFMHYIQDKAKTNKHISKPVPVATNKHIPKLHIVKKSPPIVYETFKVLEIGNFYIYKNKKYYWVDFRKALNKCKAMYVNDVKNLDSTITIYYKIKDKNCLEKHLSSVSLL